ncbi:hypothetical protein BB560_001196 [Smittium megazygosporum]|uniref:Uncharacterized protein n=1 Tax=Smittium megazygosporum TaxID=133381 RepID=A0A2T9ZI86_9FUNG|nr:hypothetical protein BB560_001196 [Smittium megazygosporum]
MSHYFLFKSKPTILDGHFELTPLYSMLSMMNFMFILGYRPFLYQEIKEEIEVELKNERVDRESENTKGIKTE